MVVGIFTDTYFPEINGVANSSYQLKRGLEKLGHKVYVFTVTNPEVKKYEDDVYRIKSLPFFLMKERRIGVALMRRWIKLIEELEIDVIHTQTEFILGHFGRKAAKKLDIPLVHTYHTIYEEYIHYLKVPDRFSKPAKGFVKRFSRKCCQKASHVVVPSEKVERLLRFYGITKPITVQPTGIDIDKFIDVNREEVLELRKRYNISETDKVLISVGRIAKEKNLEEIIEFTSDIRKIHPDTKLLIVGDGPYRKEIESTFGNVIFIGSVPWETIQNYYAMGDVFVCASTSETQGLTYFEAMAAEKPILVRRDECIEGLLKEGYNGLGYDNKEEFITAFEKIFAEKTYEQYGLNAKSSAMEFSVDVFARRLAGIYKNIIEESTDKYVEDEILKLSLDTTNNM